ncbi:MAG: CHASE2 domain-containing protein [Bryobacteraceae bacterium]
MRLRRPDIPYVTLLAGAFALALAAAWTGAQIDNSAYDWMFRRHQPRPWQTESALLAVDEESLALTDGLRNLRLPLARALERVAAAQPKAVIIDLILADRADPESDAALEAAFAKIPNLVLSSKLLSSGRGWEEPLERFARHAAAVGHVHAEPDNLDAVSRAIPLEKQTDRARRWSLALEAFRVSRGARILESPDDLQVAGVVIPSPVAGGRLMRIRYVPPNMPPIPRATLQQVLNDPSAARIFAAKVVFVGVTAQTAVRDWLMTPYSPSVPMMGLEIHANAFETIAQGRFLTGAPHWAVLGFSALLVIAAGAAFAFAPLWQAYTLAVALLAIAHLAPYVFFTRGTVFSFITPVAAAWFSTVTAAAWQHLVVRRRLRVAEADRLRYQQSMHFVTHEMRTPLTAIQGSSELIGRYQLPEEKRKQMAQLINAESKRLARMIEVFLNVERLSAGQMELRKETFAAGAIIQACLERARPLAERKRIRIVVRPVPEGLQLSGDRELMEYAFYNLITNAIKYSPPDTQVTVSGLRSGGHVRLAVEDQGIGMDPKEVRKIFQKFYRTRRAEQSGEAGTGIGLSIVQQIIQHHGGTIDVKSRPGEGSSFTLVLPAALPAAVAEQN